MPNTVPTANSKLDRLLPQLKANSAAKREDAAQKLGALGLRTEAIVASLTEVARNDSNPYPRRAAREALTKLGETPPPTEEIDKTIRFRTWFVYTDRRQRLLDFAIGFFVWFVLNGIGWNLVVTIARGRSWSQFGPLDLILLMLVINLILAGAIFIIRLWMAFGLITAYLLNFAIVATGIGATESLGIFYAAALGIPFFVSVR